MRHLNNLATFVQVANHQSVTQASKSLHLTQQAVSHQIKKLEEELGVLLFKRAHKKIYLTQEGKALLKTAEKHLQALEHDLAQVKYDTATLKGKVKIGSTLELATLILAPLIVSFKELYPQISIELELQDDGQTEQGIVHGEADVGLVVFSSKKELLDIRSLRKEAFITVASKDFIEQEGPFTSFQNVVDSQIVDYQPDCPSMSTWLNKNDKKMMKLLATKTPSVVANDDRLIKEFVMAGLGIANVPKALFEEELRQGTVVEILPKSKGISAGIDLISMKDRTLPSQVEAFIEHVIRQDKA